MDELCVQGVGLFTSELDYCALFQWISQCVSRMKRDMLSIKRNVRQASNRLDRLPWVHVIVLHRAISGGHEQQWPPEDAIELPSLPMAINRVNVQPHRHSWPSV